MVPSIFAAFQRRLVFRAMVAYGVIAFAVLQIVEPIMHGLHWPDSVLSYLVVALAAAFPVVVGVAWIFDNPEAARAATARTRPRLWLAAPAIGALALAPVLVYFFRHRSKAEATVSIAVLPFVNLSSDKEQEYFSDGLTEELLNLLARVPGLRVAARTSAFAFKGRNATIAEIGRELNVKTILEGSVRKSGDRIRVDTELIDAAEGYHLWSDSYDRKLTDIFALQDDIGKAVVAALRLKLLAPPTTIDRKTVHPEAYNEYLLGRQFLNQFTDTSFARAVDAFERAVRIDPSYAPAWAGLASARYWHTDTDPGLSAAAIEEHQQEALEAADKAVALGPQVAAAYVVRGDLRAFLRWDFAGARADLDRARALAPEDVEALFTEAIAVLRPQGQLGDAIAELRKAAALDPLNARIWSYLGGTLLMTGDLAGTRAALSRALQISPGSHSVSAHLAEAFLLEGKPREALTVPMSAEGNDPGWRLYVAALAEHDLGRAADARRDLDALIKAWGTVGEYQIADVHAWWGDKEQAFRWLELAEQRHDGGLMNLKGDPLLRGLREDPRYEALLRRMNLAGR